MHENEPEAAVATAGKIQHHCTRRERGSITLDFVEFRDRARWEMPALDVRHRVEASSTKDRRAKERKERGMLRGC